MNNYYHIVNIYSDKIFPICIPEEKMNDKYHLRGQFVSVLGYANRDRGNTDLTQKSLKVPILAQAICNSLYKEEGDYQGKIEIALPNQFNHSAIVCAGDSEKSDGTCPGDSGKYCLVIQYRTQSW